MTTLREAAQMALDALEVSTDWDMGATGKQAQSIRAITALRAALATEQEPLGYWNAVEGWVSIPNEYEPTPAAWVYPSFWDDLERVNCGTAYRNPTVDRTPLYTAPPQREWVGLTKEEYEAMAEKCVTNCYFDTLKYARAIEARLRDKNS